MDIPLSHTVVVVSHTHWDREWYHPLGPMRQRLVRLIDELLDDPDGLPFLLDGQAIVLDDYVAVRPERAATLTEALRHGQLEAGPWYVLADMLMPGGEALVRNLLEGSRTVRAAGGTPPGVLYSPDAFGHSAAGPVLAEGFGLGVAIVWRGFGGPTLPRTTVARWTHPGGASVLLYHLPPDGYEIGSSLPVAGDAATSRWRDMRGAVLGNNPLRVALLPNGADHHARQADRAAAVAALAAVAEPHAVAVDSLRGFAERLAIAAYGVTLPVVSGELRDSEGWTWSLQGTFATRAHQKRVNAQVERLLVRDTEPWAALRWFMTAHDEPSLRIAWKTLLSTHPHDTLCGCSVDEVAAAADQRWADARAQAEALRDDALRALVECDAVAQRELEAQWRPMLLVRNPAPTARGGVVTLRLIDQIVSDPVGPGSAESRAANSHDMRAPPLWSGHESLQVLQQSREFDRVESPLHYPRNAVVRVTEALAWMDSIPGYGVSPVPLSDLGLLASAVPEEHRVVARRHEYDEEFLNDHWTLSSEVQGIVAYHHAPGTFLYADGRLESVTDVGDSYTPSLRGTPVVARWSVPEMIARGPLRAAWRQSAVIERPRNSAVAATRFPDIVEGAAETAPITGTVTVTATYSLDAGADWYAIDFAGNNAACDHRLRWVLGLPPSLDTRLVVADAAFGAVERPAQSRDPQRWPAEHQLPTAPLHRWLWIPGEKFSLGIVSDGLAEYEVTPTGWFALTLVRAVGELSRRDLPERPGHAGWPAPTPAAQSQGAFAARVAIAVLPMDKDAAITRLEAIADEVLLPVRGNTWRGVATELASFAGLSLEGEGLTFSATKCSENGAWIVLRCINRKAAAVEGAWRLPRAIRDARLSRLDETEGDPLEVHGASVRFVAPPNGIVTILVR